jgi:hypothetical protein
MMRASRRCLRLLLALALAGTMLALAPSGRAEAQTGGCTPPSTTNYADAGPFQVATESDAVSTFYFPSQLGSNGCARHPVILWGNGTITAPSWYDGLLRHWASHGFIVAAANTSNAGTGNEMRQGLDTLTRRNNAAGDRFYQKVDLANVGTTGHSQGGSGAMRAAQDPRVNNAFPIEAGFFAGSTDATLNARVPTLFFAGEADSLRTGIRQAYDRTANVAAAYAELAGASHLVPLGSGGGFRGPSTAWARWRMMGDSAAGNQFVGASCGLCTSNEWSVFDRNSRFGSLGPGGGGGGGGGTTSSSTPGGGGQCISATNSQHVQAGRATTFLVFAWANGSNDYLGLTWATTSLRQSGTGWEMVTAC